MWCDTCLLPSATEILLWHDHFHLYGRFRWCTEHDGQTSTEAPPAPARKDQP